MAKDYSDKVGARRVEYLPLDAIKPAKANPKRHADEAIRQSMDRWGYTEPLLLDERTGHLVAGHGRLQSLLDKRESGDSPPEGITADWQVPVTRGWASKNDDEANGYLVADNRLTELGGWDNRELLALLDSLDDLEGVGYTLDEIQELSAKVAELSPTQRTDPDAVPPAPKTPISKLGDIWELGTHRVICGDSNEPTVLASVLQGQEPDVLLTDPPYGVNERTDRKAKGRANKTASNDFSPIHGDDKPFDPTPWVIYPKAVLFGANYFCDSLPASPSWIVWDKLDGLETDKRAVGFDDNADVEMAWTNLGGPARLIRHRWKGMLKGSENGDSRVHPTQKPVALIEQILNWRTQIGDIVLDPYGGSGSTLIACQSTNRNARMVELDPIYVDVICKRFQEHTGIKPVLESTGEPVDFTEPKEANVA